MSADPTYLGTVQDVAGATVSVALDASTGSGLLFVDGQPYRIGQVGSFVRIPLGFTDLIGIVSQAGAGAVPANLASADPYGHRWLTVQLIGEGTADRPFSRGISLLPSIGDPAHIVTETDLVRVYGRPDSAERIAIGRVASAMAIPALLDINAIVTRHSAVLGATGAGKSTTVVQVLRALTDPARYPSARALVFDIHGEYAAALEGRARVLWVRSGEGHADSLHVPYWALSFDELIPLTFGNLPDDASVGAVRDEIVRLKREALETYPRGGVEPTDVTADTPVPFSIHQLWFTLHRLLNATHTVGQGANQGPETEALELDAGGEPVQPGDASTVTPPRYRPATQAAGEEKIYLSGSALNIRRQVDGLASRLRDRRFDFLFRPGFWSPALDGAVNADLDDFLEQWLGGEEAVAVLDLSGVPTAVLTDLVGALTRVVYDALFWARRLSEGGRERPLLFVFEEAHAYLATGRAPGAASAVQRVVKEGRKYGVGAMIVSQRPSEVDPTILSQCGTVIALRLSNATDRNHVAGSVTDNLAGLLSMLPVLRTGEAIVVGEAVPLPVRALIDLPDHLPESTDPRIVCIDEPGGWNRGREPSDFADVVERWRSQDPVSSRVIGPPDGEAEVN
ncbi:MAG: ATP-binding protein [Actinobacteria bacterium]|nr:ATP-binding protein [Actinomycetota bacterium]